MTNELPRDVGRTLPHSVEAEKGVLGSMLIGGPETIEECQALIDTAMFHLPTHGQIYGLILAAYASGIPTDLITFTQALADDRPFGEKGSSTLEMVGGVPAVTEMFTFVPTAANVGYYVEILREKYILRQLIASSTETVRRAYAEQDEVYALLDQHITNAVSIGELTTSTTDRLRHVKEYVDPAVEEIKATYYSRGQPTGLTSGFHDLDRMTGGFQAPLTYYFAARPAMGKSAVMVEIAEHIALANAEAGDDVAIFSIEMTGRQLVKRILSSRAEIDLQRLRDGFMPAGTIPRLEEEAAQVKKGRLWIDERQLSINEFRVLARRAVRKHKCKIILIDYIQRMHSTSKRAQGNREQEMNEIAQGISATAKELNVPIIVLAQLNRKNQDREDKIPALSDIRESGSMEQEARFVGLLHRPIYYCLTEGQKQREARKLKLFLTRPSLTDGEPEIMHDDNGEPLVDLVALEEYAELIVAKQNEGPVGTVRLRFLKQFARYEGVTSKLYSNNPQEQQHHE